MDFFEKLDTLPEKIRDYFCSNDSRLDVEQVCFLYDVREDDIEKITLPIRDVFFKDTKLEQLPLVMGRELGVKNEVAYGIAYELNKKIFVNYPEYFEDAGILLEQWAKIKLEPIISEEKARRRLLDLEPWILEDEKKQKEENKKIDEQKKIVSISLDEALKKYPKLGEQTLSANQLKSQNSQMLVRPSIRNWVTDFHDAMGSGKHSPIDRGNYLFHSENGKNLSANERQKIAIILKSLDEQTLITVDEVEEKVVFEELEKAQQNVINQKIETKNQSEIIDKIQTSLPPEHPPRVDEQSSLRVEADLSSSEERMEVKKASSVENFFSVPGSKPPIGSDSFHVEDRKAEIEMERKKDVQNIVFEKDSVAQSAASDSQESSMQGPTFLASPNNISFSSGQKLPIEQRDAKLPDPFRGQHVISEQIEVPASFKKQEEVAMQALTHEKPFRPLQKKVMINEQTPDPKPVEKVFKQNVNPVQLRPPVQKSQPAPFEEAISKKQPVNAPQQVNRPAMRSPYHIGPSRGKYKVDDNVPKVMGNIVDLS